MPPTPPRVLHLIDPRSAGDEGVLACAAALGIRSVDHAAWIIGDTRDERRAWSLGVISSDRITPFAHLPSTAARRLRRLAADRFAASGPPDIVCCYSVAALALARTALGRRRPWRVGVLPALPVDLDSAPVARLAGFAMFDATVATFSGPLQTALGPAASARRGGTFLRDAIRLLDAPTGFSCLPPDASTDRTRLRAALGLEPGDTVIALLADPPRAGDAARLLFELGLCYTVGHTLVGLVRTGAANERRGARFVRDHGRRWNLLRADLSLVDLALAADIALISAPGVRGPIGSAGPIAGALCAALHLPLVVPPAAYPASAVDDLPPAIVAADDSRRAVAAALLKTLESPTLRSELRDGQSAWLQRARAADRFSGTLEALFHELNNTPVLRPGLPVPTALASQGAGA